MGTLAGEADSHSFLPLDKKKKKKNEEFAPLGAKAPLWRGSIIQGSNQEVTKVVPLRKTISEGIPSTLSMFL